MAPSTNGPDGPTTNWQEDSPTPTPKFHLMSTATDLHHRAIVAVMHDHNPIAADVEAGMTLVIELVEGGTSIRSCSKTPAW